MQKKLEQNHPVVPADKNAQWKRLLFYLFILALSAVFLGIFSFSTSPFHTEERSDAAFFRMVGMGMTKGMLPYRDFFDMKGPYLFLIEYLGQLISYGRTGIFILQIVNLFIALYLTTKICRLYGISSYLKQGLLLCGVLYFFLPSIDGGNLTEEWSIVPLFSCLYLFLRYERSSGTGIQAEHRLLEGFWYGLCFGYLTFIRITNAALIGAGIIAIGFRLIKEKRFKNLLLNAVVFIAGAVVAMLPAVIYFACNGLLYDMIESLFILGMKYSTENSLLSQMAASVRGRSLLLLIPCALILLTDWEFIREKLLAILIAVFTFLAISVGHNTNHYYGIVVPFVAFAGVALLYITQTAGKKSFQRICALVLAAVLTVSQVVAVKLVVDLTYERLFHPEQFQYIANAQAIADNIPDDKDNVFAFGVKTEFYTHSGIFPCNKYCGWQEHYIQLMPQIADELDEFFRTTPPSWVVLQKGLTALPNFLEREISQNYVMTYENDMYMLYKRTVGES